jgi:large subunit ribosomal protein L23
MRDPYTVIKAPLITEKMQDQSPLGIYAFLVDRRCNRVEIKHAVEKIFKVDVIRINIINMPGKRKRVRFKEGKTAAWKKAIIRVKKGQTINAE